MAASKRVVDATSLGEAVRARDSTLLTVRASRWAVPQSQAYQLLGGGGVEGEDEVQATKPITHVATSLTVVMLTGEVVLPHDGLPWELARLVRLTRDGRFLPIVHQDFLQTRAADMRAVDVNDTAPHELLLKYAPCSPGWLRFVLQVIYIYIYMQKQ